MDINDIKQFIPEDGEKIILIENGKPVVVLMSFNTYKKECESVKQDKIYHNNEEIHPETKKELTIEDLPF